MNLTPEQQAVGKENFRAAIGSKLVAGDGHIVDQAVHVSKGCNQRLLHAMIVEDLERLFGLLEAHAIRPRVAERVSFAEVAEAHRRLEAGGLEGKLVLCPDLPSS